MHTKGARIWTLVAREDATGELAGYTALFFPKHRPWQAQQGDTGVDPAHRNKGLGRWLKAANLLRLLDERPEAQVVDTDNADSNEPMLNINMALGFRPLAMTEMVQLKLS
jgi:RimJ/RimL family protein N-acetyltransferase